MFKIGWFSTGRGDGSRNLLRAIQDSIRSGQLDAEIEFVFCSRERGETEATDEFLSMVAGYGIPLVTFSYQRFRRDLGERSPDPSAPMPAWRLAYDQEVIDRISRFRPDLCLLAGFLLIFGEEMCRRYRFINLHPAAPGGPTGIWQAVIWDLIQGRASQSGAMMHLAIPELDRGPVVTYCTFPIRGGPFDALWEEIGGRPLEEIRKEQGEDNALFGLIRRHGVAREVPLIIATIRAFSQGRIRITPGGEVTDGAGRPIPGHDLTDEIERLLREGTE